MRVRITFAKTEPMRYTGHLDLHRTWERTLRRASLPLAYSQGFKPHPRIVLACALPLGCTSQQELVDIWLDESIAAEQIKHAIQVAAPLGLEILQVADVDPGLPALPTQVQASEYHITLRDPVPDLDEALRRVVTAGALPRIWRDKAYDLRPLIFQIERLTDDGDGCQRIMVVLSAKEASTGRPEEVLRALGIEPGEARIQRTRLIFQKVG
jgi:radical SAM-linked protein